MSGQIFRATTDDEDTETMTVNNLYGECLEFDTATRRTVLDRCAVLALRDALTTWLQANPDAVTKALQDEIGEAIVGGWPEGVRIGDAAEPGCSVEWIAEFHREVMAIEREQKEIIDAIRKERP